LKLLYFCETTDKFDGVAKYSNYFIIGFVAVVEEFILFELEYLPLLVYYSGRFV
jgi:hypothetical protein